MIWRAGGAGFRRDSRQQFQFNRRIRVKADAANALANTSQVVLNNGGSFLVTAENAVNDDAAIHLNGGRMAMSGNFNETVGALTLSANSTLDFAGFVGTLRFSGVTSWAAGANLAIWNWSGRTEYGTNYGTYPNSSNLVFTNNSTLSSVSVARSTTCRM